MNLQQKCPYCDEKLTFTILATKTHKNADGVSTVTMNTQTTPESTAHVWTHAPEGDK